MLVSLRNFPIIEKTCRKYFAQVVSCRFLSDKKEIILNDSDIEENFIKGGGPGGQSVNKSTNCVQLKHKPTGIVVKAHESRSLHENRQQARKKLLLQLDIHYNGDQSKFAVDRKESAQHKQEKKRRSVERLRLKQAFKESETRFVDFDRT